MKVKDIFNIESGTSVIESEVYTMQGELPCLTCQTINNGITYLVDEDIIRKEYLNKIYEEPCITWTKNGNAGYMTYRTIRFICTPDCGVLLLKNKYIDELNIEWFSLVYQDIFFKNVTAQGSQPKLNETATGNIDVDYPFPPMPEQLAYVEQMHILKNYNDKLNLVIKKCDEVLDSVVRIDETNMQGKNVCVSSIFDCMSGNSGLTDEFIYNHQNDDGEKCRVLSGATKENNELENVSISAILNGKPLKFHAGQGLLIVRKGKAGNLKYLPYDNYTMNDDAYIISVKSTATYDINLEWLAIQYGDLFKEYSSGKGNATWNKSGFFVHAKIDIPSIDFQNQVVEQYHKAQNIKNKCLIIKSEIKKIWDFD